MVKEAISPLLIGHKTRLKFIWDLWYCKTFLWLVNREGAICSGLKQSRETYLQMKRTKKQFVARGIVAALSLYSYISHEEALLSVLSNPLLYLSQLNPRGYLTVTDYGVSLAALENKEPTRDSPLLPPGIQPSTFTAPHDVLWVRLCKINWNAVSGNAC